MDVVYRPADDEVLVQSLVALGGDPGSLLGYDLLSVGASGAHVYRLRFPSGDRILKVTQAGSHPYLLEQARREILFYEYLASKVQIPVPKAIASIQHQDVGTCLLLEACETSPPPSDWSGTMFVRGAELVARLHAAYWGKERELSRFGWLRGSEVQDVEQVRRAHGHWERLAAVKRFGTILTPERHRSVRGLLRRIDSVRTDSSSLPITLCHGDFHVDNILVDQDGEFVLADWQEVGLGRGPEDLSFFLQRASYFAGSLPEAEIVEAYRYSLAANVGEEVSLREIWRVVETAELRTRLLHWPAFLVDATEDQVRHLLDRIESLADSLQLSFESDC